jgi:tetratricopeptide (TPR) repeat protein
MPGDVRMTLPRNLIAGILFSVLGIVIAVATTGETMVAEIASALGLGALAGALFLTRTVLSKILHRPVGVAEGVLWLLESFVAVVAIVGVLNATGVLIFDSAEKAYRLECERRGESRKHCSKRYFTLSNDTDKYTEALRTDPQNAAHYRNRAEAWFDLYDYDRAITDYDEALRIEPGNADTLARRSEASRLSAVRPERQPPREAPPPDDRAAAYNKSGDAWFGKSAFDRAIADYTEAIKVDPKYAAAYRNRAIAWFAKGDYGRSIADYDELLRLNADDVDAYYARGVAREQTRDYDRAIADYSEALRRNPKHVAAYHNRGSALRAKGEYQRATADYIDALRVDPTDADAYNSAARLLASAPVAAARNGARAVELATRASELMASADYVDTLAAAHAEAGNFAEAVRWQQKALADRRFAKEHGAEARQRLELYRRNQPYRLNRE